MTTTPVYPTPRSWRGPLLMLTARLLLALALQALLAGALTLAGTPEPWSTAGRWWPVYGTLIDLGCLALLWRLTHAEGRSLLDLLRDPATGRLWHGRRDLLRGLGLFAISFPLAMGGMIASSLALFGTYEPPSVYGALPWGATLYAVLIFPAIWALGEQLTYQGYCLPRLEQLSGRPWLAVLLVTLFWGLQHIALPTVWDPRFMLLRCVSFLPLALFMTLTYRRTRRLGPYILAHWLMDMLGALTGLLLPLLTGG